MNDFWNLEDGTNAADTGTDYELPGGGDFSPIPDGSSVMAMIEEAKWDSMDDGQNNFVSLRWSILEPERFKNRKVFQKLWVKDHDPSVQDSTKAVEKTGKAKKMLAAIDANAGGKLVQQRTAPTDETMTACLSDKPMVISLRVWELTDIVSGELKNGNWVCAVHSRSHELKIGEEYSPPVNSRPAPSYGGGAPTRTGDFDDEIPF